MFRKRSQATPTQPDTAPPPTERITSVLSSGITWKGQLGGSGGVRIEGTFDGDIAMRGLLVVGETGRLNCKSLRANTVIIAGVVKGDIIAERLEIRGTGRVWGDVTTASFTTEEGAFLRGQITMEERVDVGIGLLLEPVGEGEEMAESTDMGESV